MEIRISKKRAGIIGICGHVGAGHVHSHMGFVQDDSGGFAVATTLLKKALPVNSIISSVDAGIEEGIITITTEDGGVGRARARRGITPIEAQLMKRVIGMDSVFTQSNSLQAFGRIYGQGIMEVPVALQTAAALALIDTFQKKYPRYVKVVDEDIKGNIGKILGTVIEVEEIPVSLMAVVNATQGGIGPNEDLEGNILLGAKGDLMRGLKLHCIPTVVVEGKAFVPGVCDNLRQETFWIRANKQADNTAVASVLAESAEELGIPYRFSDDVLSRGGTAFREACSSLGQKVIDLGNRLKSAETSHEKVNIIGELAVLISQDAGGVTFMTDSLQEIAGSAGMIPGTSAVISLLVDPEYIKYWKIPVLTEDNTEKFISIITSAVVKLSKKIDIAKKELEDKFKFNAKEFDYLF
jgi:hypothetical protein